MRQIRAERLLLLVLLFSFFCTLGARCLLETGQQNTLAGRRISSPSYRQDFFSPQMQKDRKLLSEECRTFLRQVEEDSGYFPVPASSLDPSLSVSYVNSWMYERNYKEKSSHEGTDIMAARNERGLYLMGLSPILAGWSWAGGGSASPRLTVSTTTMPTWTPMRTSRRGIP